MTHPYTTQAYAAALSHWGQPLHVPVWRTSVMTRTIEQGYQDAAGTYPLAILPVDADIQGGLNFLRDQGLISVVLVLDDVHRPNLNDLKKHFDIVRPFKTHYTNDPQNGSFSYDSHHRYELRQALKVVRAEQMDLKTHLPAWIDLYKTLVLRHGLKGLHDFPARHFETLAELENITTFGAWLDDKLVSCHIWAHHNGYAISHLAASSDKGYKSRAAYAVNDLALQHFSTGKLLNFGGGAGHTESATDGLAKFKKGFSNRTANAYICGAILDQKRYDELLKKRGLDQKQTDFFPAYRAV